MKPIIIERIPEAIRPIAYPALFGSEMIKNVHMFSYAENLFNNALVQFLSDYNGGYFDFFKITQADVEIEATGFIPLMPKEGTVTVQNPFGTSAVISYKAACIVTWLYVLMQVAETTPNDTIKTQLYHTCQDIKYCYARFTDDNGEKMFSEADLQGMYLLIN